MAQRTFLKPVNIDPAAELSRELLISSSLCSKDEDSWYKIETSGNQSLLVMYYQDAESAHFQLSANQICAQTTGCSLIVDFLIGLDVLNPDQKKSGLSGRDWTGTKCSFF